MSAVPLSYVLPVRMAEAATDDARGELSAYLADVCAWCDDVIVVDGSPAATFAVNAGAWPSRVRHVAPDPRHASLMGKVPGVLTGLDLAKHEGVVIADDDVRYAPGQLAQIARLLHDHDVVRPQNYFAPLPWHAVWDTARTLLNRSLARDFPGTLAVRRSTLRATGGYDGDVLFENLELIRTVQAHGGRVASPLDLYIRRLPPDAGHFLGQRVRQAYDDFAIPARMAVWLSIVPLLGYAAVRRRPAVPAVLAAASVALAERGRRRGGGTAVFPALASALAPVWVTERGVCAWLAVLQRVRFGGVRYGDSVIPVAAHSIRSLRQRAATTRSSARDGCLPSPPAGNGSAWSSSTTPHPACTGSRTRLPTGT